MGAMVAMVKLSAYEASAVPTPEVAVSVNAPCDKEIVMNIGYIKARSYNTKGMVSNTSGAEVKLMSEI